MTTFYFLDSGHVREAADMMKARRHAQRGARLQSPGLEPPSHLAGGNFVNFLVGVIGWEPEP